MSELGEYLRRWRRSAGLSQLNLSLAAGCSARHLSFVETGRARAGRDFVLRLAEVLGVSDAERDRAPVAAGLAPVNGEGRLREADRGMLDALVR